jgi:hypothetical protein
LGTLPGARCDPVCVLVCLAQAKGGGMTWQSSRIPHFAVSSHTCMRVCILLILPPLVASQRRYIRRSVVRRCWFSAACRWKMARHG